MTTGEAENDGNDAIHENDENELRALLEKIAAQAGDPPEHGLEDVGAMRRRRARHRRGAVATAVVLAVAGGAGLPWLARLDDADDVTSVADAGGALPADLPDVLELNCTPAGIDVPVASIRPRSDGLHVAVDNQLPVATTVWVTSEDGWRSGNVTVDPGPSTLRQPVPPGALTVGCRIDDQEQQRGVDLVDVEGYYEEPELSCPEDERRDVTQALPVDPPTWSLVGATRRALAGSLRADDDLVAPGGYPDEHLGDPTADPTVRIVRGGDTVAFVHLDTGGDPAGDGATSPDAATTRPARQPWSRVRLVEGCASLLDGGGSPVAPTSIASAN